jgi:hypothetical protein
MHELMEVAIDIQSQTVPVRANIDSVVGGIDGTIYRTPTQGKDTPESKERKRFTGEPDKGKTTNA